MPNKQNAQYEEWKIVFEKIIDKLDNNFILIGHSLGAMFIVKYLSENTISKTIEKTLLLGTPFDNSIKTDPLAGFLRQGNLQKLAEQAGKLFFYHSEDDFAVPFEHVLKYKEALPYASFRLMKDRNHFLQEEVPELNFDILH
ncbi:MAG: alpha/beta hydrolase [Candidatus Peribacteria bacterium]|jgi:predicted alpha/beta hydrolase family esterase|nr:alpha/beta hydrolase [Candidatus Peribacteria bacterium]